jgi:hypothetical protein
MVKATDCVIDVELALRIRDKAHVLGLTPKARGDLGFRCIECGQPVKPHKGNADSRPSAHFEHLDENTKCSRSPGMS